MMTAEQARQLHIKHVQANPSEWTRLAMVEVDMAAVSGQPECSVKLRVTGETLPQLATMVHELRVLGYKIYHSPLLLARNDTADVTVTISWSGVEEDGRK